MYLFFFAFSNKNNYSSVPLSPSSPHSLYQTDRWRMRIKTYNEVNLADVQALLANTRGHQSVISSLTKPLDNLEMTQNVDNLSSCFERFTSKRRCYNTCTMQCHQKVQEIGFYHMNPLYWVKPYIISDPGRIRFKCLRFHLYEHETKYRISTTLAFSICFHLSTLTCFSMRFYPYRPHWNAWKRRLKRQFETLFWHRFQKPKSLRFHHSSLETESFQNDVLSDDSTFETVFDSFRFHQRFSAF